MENACEDRFVMQERLKKTADSLDIENLLDREMMFLSSGEKQKVAIGSVSCTYPKGFVLDEPSANLDNTATRGLADFFKTGKRKRTYCSYFRTSPTLFKRFDRQINHNERWAHY